MTTKIQTLKTEFYNKYQDLLKVAGLLPSTIESFDYDFCMITTEAQYIEIIKRTQDMIDYITYCTNAYEKAKVTNDPDIKILGYSLGSYCGGCKSKLRDTALLVYQKY